MNQGQYSQNGTIGNYYGQNPEYSPIRNPSNQRIVENYQPTVNKAPADTGGDCCQLI